MGFTTRYLLEFHEEGHKNPDLIQCSKCDKSFSSNCYKFIIHYKVHAKRNMRKTEQVTIRKSGLFCCNICSHIFDTPSQIYLHLTSHSLNLGELYLCLNCGTGFDNFYDKKRGKHKGEHSFSNYKCQLCDEYFTTSELLDLHMQLHSGKFPYECDACQRNFKLGNNLFYHLNDPQVRCKYLDNKEIKTGTLNNKEIKSGTLNLGYDNFFKNFKSEYVQSQDKTNEQFGKPFSCLALIVSNRNIHQRTLKDIYKCDNCDGTFKSFNELFFHLKSHGFQNFDICSICGQGVKSSHKLMKHKKKHNTDDLLLYQCNICDSGFMYLDLLSIHYQTKHMGKSLFHCEGCRKEFLTKAGFLKHSKRCHKNSTKRFNKFPNEVFTCGLCSQEFKTLRNLDLHNYSNHFKTCIVCGKAFDNLMELNNHKKEHAKEFPFKCSFCGNVYSHMASFIHHINIHNVNPKDLFICHVCSKPFKDRSKLKAHTEIHNYYFCKKCCRKVKFGIDFQEHKKTCKSEEVVTMDTVTSKQILNIGPTGKRKYVKRKDLTKPKPIPCEGILEEMYKERQRKKKNRIEKKKTELKFKPKQLLEAEPNNKPKQFLESGQNNEQPVGTEHKNEQLPRTEHKKKQEKNGCSDSNSTQNTSIRNKSKASKKVKSHCHDTRVGILGCSENETEIDKYRSSGLTREGTKCKTDEVNQKDNDSVLKNIHATFAKNISVEFQTTDLHTDKDKRIPQNVPAINNHVSIDIDNAFKFREIMASEENHGILNINQDISLFPVGGTAYVVCKPITDVFFQQVVRYEPIKKDGQLQFVFRAEQKNLSISEICLNALHTTNQDNKGTCTCKTSTDLDYSCEMAETMVKADILQSVPNQTLLLKSALTKPDEIHSSSMISPEDKITTRRTNDRLAKLRAITFVKSLKRTIKAGKKKTASDSITVNISDNSSANISQATDNTRQATDNTSQATDNTSFCQRIAVKKAKRKKKKIIKKNIAPQSSDCVDRNDLMLKPNQPAVDSVDKNDLRSVSSVDQQMVDSVDSDDLRSVSSIHQRMVDSVDKNDLKSVSSVDQQTVDSVDGNDLRLKLTQPNQGTLQIQNTKVSKSEEKAHSQNNGNKKRKRNYFQIHESCLPDDINTNDVDSFISNFCPTENIHRRSKRLKAQYKTTDYKLLSVVGSTNKAVDENDTDCLKNKENGNCAIKPRKKQLRKIRTKMAPEKIKALLDANAKETENNCGIYRCGHCDVSFNIPIHLLVHLTSHHAGLTCHLCLTCGFGYNSLWHNSDNKKKEHRETHANKLDELKYVCSETNCGQQFICQELKELHIDVEHKAELLLKCDICGKHFKSFSRYASNHYKCCLRSKYFYETKYVFVAQKYKEIPFYDDQHQFTEMVHIDSPIDNQQNVSSKSEKEIQNASLTNNVSNMVGNDGRELAPNLMKLFSLTDLRLIGIENKLTQVQNSGIFFCEVCHDTLNTYKDFYFHLYDHPGGKPAICLVCGRGTCTTKPECKNWRQHHEGMHQNEQLSFCCETCSDQFTTQELLELHEKSHFGHGLITCPRCHRNFNTGDRYSDHMKKSKQCKKIGKSFELNVIDLVSMNANVKDVASSASMKSSVTERAGKNCSDFENMSNEKSTEMLTSLKSEELPNYEVANKKCNKLNTSNIRSLQIKKFQLLQKKFEEARKKLRQNSNGINCKVCHKFLPFNKSYMCLHGTPYSYPEAIICTECGKVFDIKKWKLWKDHMKRLHVRNSDKMYPCHICGIAFSLAQDIKKHSVVAHGCQYQQTVNVITEDHTYADVHHKNELNENVRFVNDLSLNVSDSIKLEDNFMKKGDIFICKKCGKVLKDKKTLKVHFVGMHHDKKLTCSKCNKRFALKKYLDDHFKNVHSSILYKCQICEKTLKSNRGLKVHMEISHNQFFEKNKCHICFHAFESSKELRKHKQIYHSKLKYDCHICGHSLTSRRGVRRHIERIHEKAHNERIQERAHNTQIIDNPKLHKSKRTQAKIFEQDNWQQEIDIAVKQLLDISPVLSPVPKSQMMTKPNYLNTISQSGNFTSNHLLTKFSSPKKNISSLLARHKKNEKSHNNSNLTSSPNVPVTLLSQSSSLSATLPLKVQSSKNVTSSTNTIMCENQNLDASVSCHTRGNIYGNPAVEPTADETIENSVSQDNQKLAVEEEVTTDEFFICDVCGRLHFSSGSLTRHKDECHFEKTYNCNLCGILVHNKKHATNHRRMYHTNIKYNAWCFSEVRGPSNNSNSILDINKNAYSSDIHNSGRQIKLSTETNTKHKFKNIGEEVNETDTQGVMTSAIENYQENNLLTNKDAFSNKENVETDLIVSPRKTLDTTEAEISKEIKLINGLKKGTVVESAEHSRIQQKSKDFNQALYIATRMEDVCELNELITEDNCYVHEQLSKEENDEIIVSVDEIQNDCDVHTGEEDVGHIRNSEKNVGEIKSYEVLAGDMQTTKKRKDHRMEQDGEVQTGEHHVGYTCMQSGEKLVGGNQSEAVNVGDQYSCIQIKEEHIEVGEVQTVEENASYIQSGEDVADTQFKLVGNIQSSNSLTYEVNMDGSQNYLLLSEDSKCQTNNVQTTKSVKSLVKSLIDRLHKEHTVTEEPPFRIVSKNNVNINLIEDLRSTYPTDTNADRVINQVISVPQDLSMPFCATVEVPEMPQSIHNTVVNLPDNITAVDVNVINLDSDDQDVYLFFSV